MIGLGTPFPNELLNVMLFVDIHTDVLYALSKATPPLGVLLQVYINV